MGLECCHVSRAVEYRWGGNYDDLVSCGLTSGNCLKLGGCGRFWVSIVMRILENLQLPGGDISPTWLSGIFDNLVLGYWTV